MDDIVTTTDVQCPAVHRVIMADIKTWLASMGVGQQQLLSRLWYQMKLPPIGNGHAVS